jgi:hypothetical protein
MTTRSAPGLAGRFLIAAVVAGALASCGDDTKTPDAARKDAAPDAHDAAPGSGGGGGTGGAGGATGGSGGSDAAVADAPSDVASTDGGGAVCPASGTFGLPTVPPALQVPAGATLAFRTFAQGSQIYTCAATQTASDGGTSATTYAWTLKEPQATLYDDSCKAVGTHFAGPTWKWTADGSQVVGSRVAAADSPVGAIQWLLLAGVSHSGAGMMADVSYVQRLFTVGGVAPATGCDAGTVTQVQSVPYTATYYFYKGGAPDGGAGDRPVDAAPSCVPSTAGLTAPSVPADIQAPSGTTLALKLRANGSQIYTCSATVGAADAGTTYAWTFKAPDAKLFDDGGCGEVVSHYAGPTWKWTADGSTVVGARIAQVNSPTGWIPWLLLGAQSHAGTGVFSSITYIQRVDTVGGVAPPAGCDASKLATDQAVPYTAYYYFYRGGQRDGGSDGATDGPALDAPASDGGVDAATDGGVNAATDGGVDAASDASGDGG